MSVAAIQAIYGERRRSVASNFSSRESKEEGDKLFKVANRKRLSFQGCRIFRLCSRAKTDGDRTDAAKMYLLSAHHFMNCGQWDRAGEAYEHCGRLQELGSDVETVDAAASYNNAALCYKHDRYMKEHQAGGATGGNAPAPIRASRSVSLAMELTRVPSIDEEKLKVIDTSLSRLAHMQMDFKHYQKAMRNFEKLALTLHSNPETAANADDFFFKAAMCGLMCCEDKETLQQHVEGYFKERENLQKSKEFTFWQELFTCKQKGDEESFKKIVEDNKDRKIWIQKILIDISCEAKFGDEIERKISDRNQRKSIIGLKNDPFYTLYN